MKLVLKLNPMWALYLMLCIYGITLSWFLYVGPVVTYIVAKEIIIQRQRIVISLTTTPYRMAKIQSTLDSLRDQSIKADRIYVNIPYTYRRENIPYNIPAWLQDYPGIELNRTEDYGPITKLIPALDAEQDPNTIIITVDDDVYYPRQVVRDLVQYALRQPNSVVSPINMHFTVNKDFQFTNVEYKFKHASTAALVIGAAGVAYRRGFFKAEFKDYLRHLPAQCFLTDDLVIAMYLAYHHINIEQTIKNSFNPLVLPFIYKELTYKSTPDALSFASGEFSGNQIRYAACLANLNTAALRHYQSAFLAKL